jgi:hypothetical protein
MPQSVIEKHRIDLAADPFIPDGWTFEIHRKPASRKNNHFEWDIGKVKLHLESCQKGKWDPASPLCEDLCDYDACGNLRVRLSRKPALNANVLDYLLANPSLIPESWKGKEIHFWGTIYFNRDRSLCIRNLRWDGSSWGWGSSCIGMGGTIFGKERPALVRRVALSTQLLRFFI